MQTTFERTHDNYNIVQRYRVEAEKQHEILQKQYEAKKEEADEQLKKVLKTQEELNQLNRTLNQVSKYNEVIEGEIRYIKRTTHRAEESVVNMEGDKQRQDLLIDSMNEEIKRLNEQKTLYQAQLISQKEETAAARNTLKEAAAEIDKIVLSKTTLFDDWKNALLNVQKRDDALQSIRILVDKRKNDILKVKSEIEGVMKETQQEMEKSERLHGMLEKCEHEMEMLKQKKNDIENDSKRLREQFLLLKTSLNSTEDESREMDLQKA